MEEHPAEPVQPIAHHRRRTFIVDKSMQLGAVFAVVGIGAGFALIGVVTKIWGGDDHADGLTSDEASRLAFLVDGLFVALAVAAVAVYIVWLTHRVAGPARVIRQALEGLLVNDFGRRTRLRKKDFLKDVAESAGKVAQKLRVEREELRTLTAELDRFLARGEIEPARQSLRSFRDAHGLVVDEFAVRSKTPVEATTPPG